MSEHPNTHASLGEMLRRGDPAGDGREPDASEIAALRQALLTEAERPPARAWLAAPAWAVASALLLATWLGWQARWTTAVAPQARPDTMTVSETPRVEEPRARQIQFATPGGTRVVWVLDPDFEV